MSKSASTRDMFPGASNDFVKGNGATDTRLVCREPSLTRQEFAEECDINALMSRYDGHDIGALMRSSLPPMYFDFSEMPDTLLDYMALMDNAKAAFMTLPAVVRREFDNDASLFCDFAADPTNVEQMRAWGLAAPAPVKEQAFTPPPGDNSPPPKADPVPS